MIRETILQSKMNNVSECQLKKHLDKAIDFIFWSNEINKWHSIEKVPASIIGELFSIWNEGVIVGGMKIEIDETDQYFRIIKIKEL